MGGMRQAVKLDGRDFWTLFDTGTRNTCVVPTVAALLSISKTRRENPSGPGGFIHPS